MRASLENKRRRAPAEVEVPDGGVRVFESHHATDFEMPLGAWPYHKIGWVAFGCGNLEASGFSAAIQKDDFLILPAGMLHRFVDDPGQALTLVILCISEKFLVRSGNAELWELWDSVLQRHPAGTPLCAKTAFCHSILVRYFRRALGEQANQLVGWELALTVLAQHLILHCARKFVEPRGEHHSTGRRTVEGVIEYIDDHLNESLRIETIAELCQMSPRRFTDVFKQSTGETFTQYVNRRRVEFACRRLRETGHIMYACLESGFNDLAYFYRVFKKHTGRTPGEFLVDCMEGQEH